MGPDRRPCPREVQIQESADCCRQRGISVKRITIAIAILLLASSLAAGESSPDRSHVKISEVPRACLDTGSAQTTNYKYTCTKVDASDVWNDVELRRFEKEIYEASKQPIGTVSLGLVVKQDTLVTRQETDYKGETAVVERRDGTKYRYSRR